MRVDIDFINIQVEPPQAKIVTVNLTDEEVAKIRAGSYEDFEIIYMAKALQHAYRDLGPGWVHIPGPEGGIRLVNVH